MEKNKIYQELVKRKEAGYRSFAVLLDPDKLDSNSCMRMINLGVESKIDFFFVGGSLLTNDNFSEIIRMIRENSNIPVVIFPGSNMQIDASADAILLLSLISGRNPDYLIGQHVIAAPILRKSGLELLPTGYMLVDCGKQTTVSYVSNTTPIPYDKPAIAACTAMAGEMLGLKLIYMDGGSGAQQPIGRKMIAAVRKMVNAPIIVGGGINTAQKAVEALTAGADVIVVGNGIEKDPNLLVEISDKIHEMNRSVRFG